MGWRLGVRWAASLGAFMVSPGVTAQVTFADDLRGEIEEVIEGFHAAGGFHGQVVVSIGDSVVVDGAWGMASHELSVPLTVDHRLLLASVSKSFTAAAVLRLVDQGDIELHASAARYLEAAEIDSRITIHHLLTHTSGLARDLLPGTLHTRREHFSTPERVRIALSHGLRFEPGARYAYSSCGYVILGAILEAVTGMPLDRALDTLVFEPLGMTSAGLEADGALIPNRAGRYERLLGEVLPASFEDPTFAWGSGSVSATARDVWRFARGLLEEDFLSPQLQAAVWTDHGDGQGYGVRPFRYGTGSRRPSDGGIGFGYDGGTAGVSTIFNVLVEHETIVVVLANHTPFEINRLSNPVMNLALGYEPEGVRPQDTSEVWDAFVEGGPSAAARHASRLRSEGRRGAVPSAFEVYQVGYGLYRHHDLDRAEAVLRMRLQMSPSAAAWVTIGRIELQRGDIEAACEAFEEANDLGTDRVRGLWNEHCDQDRPTGFMSPRARRIPVRAST